MDERKIVCCGCRDSHELLKSPSNLRWLYIGSAAQAIAPQNIRHEAAMPKFQVSDVTQVVSVMGLKQADGTVADTW